MHNLPRLSLLALFLTACVADAADPSVTTDPSATTSPSVPTRANQGPIARPQIRSAAWRWGGCGPQANALPRSLTVDVVIDSTSEPYALKGQATGCDAFDASGQLRVCTGNPAGPTRNLGITVGDQLGIAEMRSVPVVDCTDGKVVFPAPAVQ